jgi:ATP-dependent Clp protease protease subunit
MVEIDIYKPIDREDPFMSFFGWDDLVFSADNIHRAFDENPTETDFRFNINCDGGSVAEGLRIYDVLRTSGKNIYMNIEGGCHSMAVCLLLAAAKENRTANPNCRALIHEVRACTYDNLTADDAQALADEIRTEQEAILDIYVDRTGTDRQTLEELMKAERQLTAEQLKEYGFISKINVYTTNRKKHFKTKNFKEMAKTKKEVISAADNFMKKLKNLLSATVVNYDHKDADGNVLFTTEAEDDTLEVGMAASPDGEFELADGRVVVITDGVIAEIREADGGEGGELENLRARVAALEGALTEANNVITDLRNEVGSTYTVRNRQTQPQGKAAPKTSAELKNEAKEKLEKMKGGK